MKVFARAFVQAASSSVAASKRASPFGRLSAVPSYRQRHLREKRSVSTGLSTICVSEHPEVRRGRKGVDSKEPQHYRDDRRGLERVLTQGLERKDQKGFDGAQPREDGEMSLAFFRESVFGQQRKGSCTSKPKFSWPTAFIVEALEGVGEGVNY